jgi:hypothetical protein
MQLVIRGDGSCRCLYSEAIDLRQLGSLLISRASHVEPNATGQWLADLSPVGGPQLGPFATRSQALAAEEAWLLTHRLSGPE